MNRGVAVTRAARRLGTTLENLGGVPLKQPSEEVSGAVEHVGQELVMLGAFRGDRNPEANHAGLLLQGRDHGCVVVPGAGLETVQLSASELYASVLGDELEGLGSGEPRIRARFPLAREHLPKSLPIFEPTLHVVPVFGGVLRHLLRKGDTPGRPVHLRLVPGAPLFTLLVSHARALAGQALAAAARDRGSLVSGHLRVLGAARRARRCSRRRGRRLRLSSVEASGIGTASALKTLTTCQRSGSAWVPTSGWCSWPGPACSIS